MTTVHQRRVLLWTENYQIGGCDRFLTDLYHAVNPTAWSLHFSGNENPEMDRFLTTQGVQLRRITIPIRSVAALSIKVNNQRVSPQQNASHDTPIIATCRARRATRLTRSSLEVLRPTFPVVDAALRYAFAPVNYRRQIRLLKNIRPDVVFINNGGYPAAESCRTMALAAHSVGTRRIIHAVHNIPAPPVWPSSAERALDRRLAEVTDAWIAGSDFTSNLLSERRSIPRNRIHTIRHGLPAIQRAPSHTRPKTRKKFNCGVDDILISVVALFDQRKGHDVFIRALAQLSRDSYRPQFKAVLVGDGDTRTRIEQQVHEAGLSDSVTFTGWLDDIDTILDASDILALPSIGDESLPYAILHAMQHALPVVASRVAGIPEQVIDGLTGFVTEPGDATAIRDALLQLRDPAIRIEMGKQGWERLRDEFDPNLTVQKITALWE